MRTDKQKYLIDFQDCGPERVKVTIDARNSDIKIELLDWNFCNVPDGIALGRLEIDLPPGFYKIEYYTNPYHCENELIEVPLGSDPLNFSRKTK